MTLHSIPANPVPEGAVSDFLTTADGVKLRFARWNPATPRKGTVCLLGLKLHILVAGATFNLHTRQAQAGSLAPTKE